VTPCSGPCRLVRFRGPRQTAVREAKEEIGVQIQLTGLLDVLGGPDFEVTYPHGDRCAYVVPGVGQRQVHSALPLVVNGRPVRPAC
jgi:8-oxo-dGTP pyrophosphatase MutT (NUDIX family)